LDNQAAYGKIEPVLFAIFPEKAKFSRFASDGNYISNDWTKSINGEEYRSRITAYRSDLLGRSDAVFAQKAESIFKQYSQKYGWTDSRPGSLIPKKQINPLLTVLKGGAP
jgi:hypothetical protein